MSRNPIYTRLINNYRWQLLRAKKLAAAPLCEHCLKKNITRPATEVHHLTPVERGVTEAGMRGLAYDWNNLVSLCRECHKDAHSYKPPPDRAEMAKKIDDFVKKFLTDE